MKKYIIMLSIAFISSCVTQKQRTRICSECPRKDSVSVIKQTLTTQKDTTIYKTIPGPIQYLENPCKWLCDSLGNLKDFTPKTKKENGSKGTVFTVGNSIGFKCDIDSADIAFSWTENHTIKETISHTEKTIQKPCELKHIGGFDYFCFWGFWLLVALLFIRYLPKIIKWIRKVWIGV